MPVKVPDNYEGSSIGAAILALKAIGEIMNYEEVTQKVSIKRAVLPTSAGAAAYIGLSEHFHNVYEQMKPLM